MSDYPTDLRYTREHEWVRDNGDGTVTIGITKYAAKEIGDVVFVELPEVGARFEEGDGFGTVESVKAVSELFVPLAGTVSERNDELADSPELVNEDPYGEGWMIRLRPSDTTGDRGLMSAADYGTYVSPGGE